MIRPVAQTHNAMVARSAPIIGWFLAFMTVANISLVVSMISQYGHYKNSLGSHLASGESYFFDYFSYHPPYDFLLINISLFSAFIWIHKYYVVPLNIILNHVGHYKERMMRETYISAYSAPGLRSIAIEFGQLIGQAIHAEHDREVLKMQLEKAQAHIMKLSESSHWMANQACAESDKVFRTIRSYAHYLEELIIAHQADDTLRYDYDEVCEVTHNLQFLTHAMTLLMTYEQHQEMNEAESCNISNILSAYLMRIAPALERRSMRLNTEQCRLDISLDAPSAMLHHAIWALLYASMHYAADDTTLYIATSHKEDQLNMQFHVTDSCPATLSDHEREGYLQALVSHKDTINMFAHAMAAHPNVQLASRMAAHMGGSVACIPTHAHGCTIEFILPLKRCSA